MLSMFIENKEIFKKPSLIVDEFDNDYLFREAEVSFYRFL